MNITEILGNFFWGSFPWSLAVIIIPIVIFIWWSKKSETNIENEVMVFFKGQTYDFYPLIIDKGVGKFTIDEAEYYEPITHKPRIGIKENRIKRTYLYAEGLGFVDVPPLSPEDRKTIIEYLIKEKIIKGRNDLKEAKSGEIRDEVLIRYVTFYNFDIEQITDKPFMKDFAVGMDMFASLIGALIRNIRSLDVKDMSNFRVLVIYAVGILTGWGFAWALTLKGVI